mmetsp:Transcript_2834/g.7183  ORF Transcript_2834/g.7183 Transcript_2834/m.7183 type:complete len:212 (-) Transcript_2834:236-871(-)
MLLTAGPRRRPRLVSNLERLERIVVVVVVGVSPHGGRHWRAVRAGCRRTPLLAACIGTPRCKISSLTAFQSEGAAVIVERQNSIDARGTVVIRLVERRGRRRRFIATVLSQLQAMNWNREDVVVEVCGPATVVGHDGMHCLGGSPARSRPLHHLEPSASYSIAIIAIAIIVVVDELHLDVGSVPRSSLPRVVAVAVLSVARKCHAPLAAIS